MRLLLAALCATASSAMTCPGSGAWIHHASCELSLSFSTDCASVSTEIGDRIAGKGGWYDPHNRGVYSVSSSSASQLEGERKTGNGKYTDKFIFTFTSSSAGCAVTACSEALGTCGYHDFSQCLAAEQESFEEMVFR